MLIEITNYYAQAGRADAVLEQRRRATALRVRLGLPAGRTFRKLEGDGPDVRWECVFATRADYESDMAARTAAPDFTAAREAMRALVDRFERHLQEEV